MELQHYEEIEDLGMQYEDLQGIKAAEQAEMEFDSAGSVLSSLNRGQRAFNDPISSINSL